MRAIRILRCALGIGPGEFAARSGVSRRELFRLEEGQVLPQSETARALDNAFIRIINERLVDWQKRETP